MAGFLLREFEYKLMGARPPQNDSSEPEVIEFGIAALSARLDEAAVEFPATSSELCAAVDDTAIPVDGAGNTMELETALQRLPQDRFDNESALLDMLHPVFEEYRKQAGDSIFGRLRTLLPF
ncbi:hypothetical protein halTADL_0354 [Halohasta litchfieldiae]|uniref:Uncharacterized protein n=2 Tax=Halohasta litchfieldiae TaxID=1073996 RepID=A0A1H6U759_9EURY|nr:hypothetical protein halTADL_0354 [Halohasta litchfieldiae]SEI84135.1 hypothetical protein SAMN05444271_10952 [Halohasta litchfieldiae]